jgi:branched-chain amino acid transport system ATP-binding protein
MRLVVESLNAYYGRAQVLFDVSLHANSHEVLALIGRNGAGKSTTFKSIVGLVGARKGRIHFTHNINFDPVDISRLPVHKIVELGLGYVPEDRRIFTDLTVEENLDVGTQSPRDGVPQWSKERLFALFPNLAEMRKRPAGRMSGGEQQMLTIARSLMGNPSLIMLDEPSEGLAPKVVEDMANAILAMKKEGLAVLISEQNLHFAKMISNRAYIIEKGRICFQGSMADLAANEEIRKKYLAV